MRVLVIDDDPATLKLVGKVLERRGYEIATAETGEAGLTLLEERNFHALVVDRHLPGMLGEEVARHARERKPHLAVVMISAVSRSKIEIGDFVEVFLRKPFEDLSQLEKAVSVAIRMREDALLRARLSQAPLPQFDEDTLPPRVPRAR